MSKKLDESIRLPNGYTLHLYRSEAKPWDLWVSLKEPNGDELLSTKCEDEDECRFRAFAIAVSTFA